jgi:hypothetical protein
MIGMSP